MSPTNQIVTSCNRIIASPGHNLDEDKTTVSVPSDHPAVAAESRNLNYDEQLKSAMALWKSNQLSEAANAVAALIKADPKRWEGYGLAGAIKKAQNRRTDCRWRKPPTCRP